MNTYMLMRAVLVKSPSPLSSIWLLGGDLDGDVPCSYCCGTSKSSGPNVASIARRVPVRGTALDSRCS